MPPNARVLFLIHKNRAHSEKCTAAREWNIHMVNHLWLEETYAKWKIMSITDPKYTHFPRRTNLMEVVGQTRIDTDTIEQFYNLEDASPEKPRRANGSAGRTATMQTGSNTPTPAKRRHTTYEEDSPAPPSTGRKAKERATARLHDTIMPDVALYQKEMKRKGGVMGGKSRAGSADSPSEKSLVGRKRSKSEESEDDSLATKKNKKRPPKPTISLLITAYTGWLDKPHKEDAEKVWSLHGCVAPN